MVFRQKPIVVNSTPKSNLHTAHTAMSNTPRQQPSSYNPTSNIPAVATKGLIQLEIEKRGLLQTKVNNESEQTRNGFRIFFVAVSLAVLVLLSIIVAWGANNGTPAKNDDVSAWNQEPTVPGIMPGKNKPRIVLAAGVGYPPYADIETDNNGDKVLGGFAVEFAKALPSVCNIDVKVTQSSWDSCFQEDTKEWDAVNNKVKKVNGLGFGMQSNFHGCIGYSKSPVRSRYLEFSESIVKYKASGILTRLDSGGNPHVNGKSNLDGKKIVNVLGWAPDTNAFEGVKNSCGGNKKFSNYKFIDPVYDSENAPTDALRTLLDGSADAMWTSAEIAGSYKIKCNSSTSQEFNCTLWNRFGTDFAYIHTGMLIRRYIGTTLAISNKGSGLSKILNPCIKKCGALSTDFLSIFLLEFVKDG